MKRYIYMFSAFIVTTLLSSCSLLDFLKDKDDSEDKSVEDVFVVVDTENITPFDCILFSDSDNTTTFINLNEDGGVRNAIVNMEDSNEQINISVSDEGNIKSISNKDVTFAFSYPDDKHVSMATVLDDEIFLIEDLDYTYSDGSETRGMDNFANWVEGTSFNQGLYTFSKKYGFIWGLVKGQTSIVSDALNGNNAKLIYDFASMNLSALSVIPSTGLQIASMTDIGIEAVSGAHPLIILGSVLANYSSWVDLCESFFDVVIPLMENSNEKTDAGIGSLNSGNGDLKVTLTWGFYADIDLHAIEPSGTHIYYDNKRGDNGYLDVDNRVGGSGATENIYWSNPSPGVYDIYLHYYGKSRYNGLSQSGVCNVTIFHKNQGKTYRIPISEGTKPVASIEVDNTVRSGSEKDQIIVRVHTDLVPKLTIPNKEKE